MEAIKGSDVNVPDAVFAWMLDGRGGVKPLENTDVIDEAHPCWLHLNYVHHDSAQWLATTPLLPNNVRDALAGESTRPRVSRLGEGTLITLRCINGSTDERPDQLVAMRVYMDGRLIVFDPTTQSAGAGRCGERIWKRARVRPIAGDGWWMCAMR
ncbi:zinc transport protein [Escherichia coli]|uniref:Zinc transport protein n=1 Tax=Escherichia coli TaxID=562 RepID=A0A377DT19_ECOLX|nr:zinc transport protein [Escherichia coli]